MIGIVVALLSEAKYVIENMVESKEIFIADKKAYMGKISNQDVILAISGIGKVSATLTTQLLIDKFNPNYILNFGTCGGTSNKVNILDYYLIESCCQFDFDVSELDDVPVGYIQDYDRVFFNLEKSGLEFLPLTKLATADRFTSKQDTIDLVNDMGCSIRDMEGGAIAQVCASNKVPLYMIKGISDVHGSGIASEQFFKNLSQVAKNFPQIIIKAINSINI